MKITYVAWDNPLGVGLSIITEDEAEADAFAGENGIMVRIITKDGDVVMCAIFSPLKN